ncbi:MAG TPA: universal stress protein [Methanocorpusculum sp.]|nr:universal stress protein [Methanocorpusculum sp.]
MFSKILVALDGSEISLRSFEYALSFAKNEGSELHAIYVIESGHSAPGPMDNNREIISQRFETEGHELLDKITAKAIDEGVKLSATLERGHAGDVIVKYAEKLSCDLIIIGSLGKTKLDRLILGSVSSYVVKSAKTNILIIRN